MAFLFTPGQLVSSGYAFASVCLFVCICVWVFVCSPAIVKQHNPIRMMAAVINLIRGPLGFAVCQCDICPSCHLDSATAFDVGAPLTCNLSSAGSCGYLEGDIFHHSKKKYGTDHVYYYTHSGSNCVLGCLQDKNPTSLEKSGGKTGSKATEVTKQHV